MSSTNKTTNYELSQFLGTDKPAWLSDYNTDMSKIDTQMKANADGVTANTGASTANATAIGTLANLTTEAKTNLVSAINEVDSHADTAQGTASSANTIAGQAKTTADGLVAYFTLTGHQNLSVTATQGTISVANTNIASASNTAGSLGKVYGSINLSFSSAPTGNVTLTIADTSLRPTENITIRGVIQNVYTSQGFSYSGVADMVVHTDGTVTITVTLSSITTSCQFILPPCLYFMNNFGD